MTKPIQSMTGFSSVEAQTEAGRFRLEFKALNHRFLDVKFRIPKEFLSAEIHFRTAMQEYFSRGSIEVKMDRVTSHDSSGRGTLPHSTLPVQTNLALAHEYFDALTMIQKSLGLQDPVRISDILALPGVIGIGSSDLQSKEAWNLIKPLALQAIKELFEMRKKEGSALVSILNAALETLRASTERLRARRVQCAGAYPERIQEKIATLFKHRNIQLDQDTSIETMLASRVAQELALLLDRTDIEEELGRLAGHIEHFAIVLKTGGSVGRKLDFLLQEMQREINTMGNKAQDMQISEEVVSTKVCLEQLREQVMNIE